MKSKLLTVALAGAVAAGASALPSLAAGTTTVLVKDNRFSPKTLTVKKGTTVKWVWKRTKERHNVAVAKGPTTFRASTRKKGSFSHTFKKRGTYRLVCTIHAPDMRMRVTVK
jgi:plastocyanin